MESPIQRQVASFSTAPTEVLLRIALEVPDLQSLYHLAIAVPSIYRLWEPYGAEILRTVTSNRASTSPQIRDLIWLVTLLRTGEMPVWSFNMFMLRFVRPTMLRDKSPEDPCIVPAPTSCPFGMLRTASLLCRLSRSCLEYYLKKLRAVQPKLQRPRDREFNYVYGSDTPPESRIPGFRREVEGVFYETPHMGPASWVEQQVALRACWWLQLVHGLKYAARKSQLTGWSGPDVARIARLRVRQLFPCTHAHMLPYHQIVGVLEYLQNFRGVRHLYQRGSMEEGVRMIDIPESSWYNRPGFPRTDNTRGPSYVPGEVSNRAYLNITLLGLIARDESPIKHVPSEFYRRLGFSFWDEKRLGELQLADPTPTQIDQLRDAVANAPKFWFSWRSMLSEAQIGALVVRLEVEEAENERARQEGVSP